MTDWSKLREALLERCQGYCEWCDRPLSYNPDDWAAHHRKLRSQGGRDELENLLAVHHGCHNLHTKSIHLRPVIAYERGALVHSWDDPTTTPLTRMDGSKVMLRGSAYQPFTEEQS